MQHAACVIICINLFRGLASPAERLIDVLIEIVFVYILQNSIIYHVDEPVNGMALKLH